MSPMARDPLAGICGANQRKVRIMTTLSLSDTVTAIRAAFERWRSGDPTPLTLHLSGHDVPVAIRASATRFECSTPGYSIANDDIVGLKIWLPKNISIPPNFGGLTPRVICQGHSRTTVILMGPVVFEFHVDLDDLS